MNAREPAPPDFPNGPSPGFRPTLVESPLPVVSLIRQLRDGLREPRRRLSNEQKPAETPLAVSDIRPWYRELPDQLRWLFTRQDLPASAGPSEVPEIWQDFPPHPASWGNSLLLHLMALSAILLPFTLRTPVKQNESDKDSPFPPYTKITLPSDWGELIGMKPDRGGGGGGDRSPIPATKGAIPVFTQVQLAPPVARFLNPDPELPVPPSLVGRPDLKLPEMMTRGPWGDPNGVLGPDSNGPGSEGGIGDGSRGGVGPGRGPGYDKGEGGNVGGERFVYGAGFAGVVAPVPTFKPEPAYTEEARKAKHQGNVTLMIIVGPEGSVTDARVVKPLGMGLDEKALETVRAWRFRPGTRDGVPVPVRVFVEVSFRLF